MSASVMMAPKLSAGARDRFLLWICVSLYFAFASCSIQAKIPTVVDDRVEGIVRSEAARIVAVSEDRENFSKYQFLLSDFPRNDLLGMSVGNRRIYISYRLASLALTDSGYQWLLRQIVAHEIAHETAAHANKEGAVWLNGGRIAVGASGGNIGLPWYVRFYNYSIEKELEADLKGLGYWNKLGWDCRIWVSILENFQKLNYTGDVFHPTDERLQQAQRACAVQRGESALRSTNSEVPNNVNARPGTKNPEPETILSIPLD